MKGLLAAPCPRLLRLQGDARRGYRETLDNLTTQHVDHVGGEDKPRTAADG